MTRCVFVSIVAILLYVPQSHGKHPSSNNQPEPKCDEDWIGLEVMSAEGSIEIRFWGRDSKWNLVLAVKLIAKLEPCDVKAALGLCVDPPIPRERCHACSHSNPSKPSFPSHFQTIYSASAHKSNPCELEQCRGEEFVFHSISRSSSFISLVPSFICPQRAACNNTCKTL